MTDKKKQDTQTTRTAFSEAGRKTADSVTQQQVNRECRNPVTPYKIKDEDWKYGIGLN